MKISSKEGQRRATGQDVATLPPMRWPCWTSEELITVDEEQKLKPVHCAHTGEDNAHGLGKANVHNDNDHVRVLRG